MLYDVRQFDDAATCSPYEWRAALLDAKEFVEDVCMMHR